MGEFGWAYISGSDVSAAQGTDGSVQLREAGSTAFSGSGTLVFDTNANLKVTGAVLTKGRISASAEVSASAFWGDGSNLTGITSVNIATDGANRMITADGDGTMTAEPNLTFDGSIMILTGTLNVSGAVNANELNINVTNKSVANISITGSTKFGDTADDTHQFTGSVFVNANLTASNSISASVYYGDGSNLTGITSVNIANDGANRMLTADGDGTMSAESNLTFDGTTLTVTGDVSSSSNLTASAMNLYGISAGTATTSSYLALDSNNNVVLTSSSGGTGGTIGEAEDEGGYDDGLFTDFTTSTAIGTPIDRFNEVLKILAPTPAPAVSRITSSNTTGVAAKLSFGSSKVVSGYTSSATTAGFTAVDATGIYSASVSGSNFRLGVYDGSQDITGEINYHVVESLTNGYMAYSNDAFGNANEGTLKLELNGTVIHSVALSGLAGSGNPNTGSANSLTNQSGFTNVSVTASSFDGNNSEWYIFKYRTAKFKVDTDQQKVGWNYVRVIHSLASDNETNYIEWINDPSGAAGVANMSASNGRIEDIVLVGSKYLSGVEYNTDATAKYKVDLINLYSNVYAASGTPISFTATNSPNPSSAAVTDLGGSDDKSKILGVTASLDFDGSTLFNGTITCNTTVTHPLKTTITNTGSATTGNSFLIDNRTLASTDLEEKFHDESYRKTSGSYDTQGSVTAAASNWNSENHMTGGGATGHTDGLLFHNQRLYSPVDGDIPNGGNFGAISNVSSGQPNYSTIVGTRTFYRVVSNSSGVAKRDMKIVSTKNSTRYNNLTLGASNVHFFAKIPGSTGWMDISQPFAYGSTLDGNGALITTATNNSNTGSTDNGNSTHFISFGTQSVSNGDHVMIKILADESWGGYLSELSFSVGATTNTATNTGIELDNILLDNVGSEVAKLSFGANNNVAEYINATGSSIGLSDFNINSTYNKSGGTRRGVFKAAEVMGGKLNENIIGNGSNYPSNSFKDAYTGSLLLIVNEVTASTMALDSLDAGNNLSSNTGFSLDAVGFSTTSDGIPDYTKPYRTGTYSIGTNQQNAGWNYARVIHRIGATDTLTSYVEWVVDPSGSTDDTAVSTPTLSDFGHTDLYYQSGIGYYATNPTASFSFSGSNFYRNVYATGSAISFPTTTNCTVTNIRMSGSGITTTTVAAASSNMALLNSSSNCHLTDIQVTGTMLYDGATPSISGGLSLFTDQDVTVTGKILHPFKSDKTTSGASKNNLFVYSGSLGSTNLNTAEYFGLETYRIVSGNYANQEAVTSSANSWNSQTAMDNGGNHDDGMVTAAGYAISPLQIGVAGNTGHASLQVPAGNPDYSNPTNNTRTYYRYFKYTSASTVASFTLTLRGDATLVGKTGTYAATLGANKNCFVELKIPYDPNYPGADDQSTGWADCAKIFESGNQPNNDGAGIRTGDFTGEDQTIDSGGLALSLTLGNYRIKQNQYVVVKISAHEDWTGYLSRIEVTY